MKDSGIKHDGRGAIYGALIPGPALPGIAKNDAVGVGVAPVVLLGGAVVVVVAVGAVVEGGTIGGVPPLGGGVEDMIENCFLKLKKRYRDVKQRVWCGSYL